MFETLHWDIFTEELNNTVDGHLYGFIKYILIVSTVCYLSTIKLINDNNKVVIVAD